jgi:CO/xanthine dehydrogenase FAD-binding subunit
LYARPADVAEALRLLASPGARVLAGGTDVFPATGERPLQGDYIDVSRIPAMRDIDVSDDEVRIGGSATWTDIVRADLPPAFRALQAAAREVGAIQIQNRATVAGNLCNASPAADGAPPLLILDAEVELTSMRGPRRLPLSRFIAGNRATALEAGEIMTAVIARTPKATMRSTFLKLGARRYLVISTLMVAVLLDIDDGRVREARIAIGACSAAAKRVAAAEARLIGAPARAGLGEALTDGDFASLSPIDDVRATALYRRQTALVVTRRALDACLRGEAGGLI